MRDNITRTGIYKEFDKETNDKFFNTKSKAVLENVDSLYFNVFLKSDTNESFITNELLTEIKELKEFFRETREEQLFHGLNVCLGKYGIYDYRLSSPDLFDIFISDYLPNQKTARIVIQLRSYGLWLYGVDEMLNDSFNKLKEVLSAFDLSISHTLENRFDYAYHTNMIQNSKNYFSDEKLLKHLKSTMDTYSKVGQINTNDGGLTINYFSLGHRSSNNIFVRMYNKTREVVEMGYKAFFFKIWEDEELISFYDRYCLEFAYKKKNYESLYLGMLHFYLDYGTVQDNKVKIIKLISNHNSRYVDFKELALSLMPEVTIINNIEFETKRTFYRFSDRQIDTLLKTDRDDELKRIYQIYNNRDIFLKYLTSTTVCFVKDKSSSEFQSWWGRIANKKLSNCTKKKKEEIELIREYNKDIDLESAITRSVNSIGTASLYRNRVDTSLVEDFSAMLGMLNDNDIFNSDKKIAFVDSETGEIIEILDEKISEKYKDNKLKKYSQVKNRIPSTLPKPQESTIQTDR